MDLLSVEGGGIVDAEGRAVTLRGTCVGGWMNMENFIDGYPGAEHGLREAFGEILGPDTARFFFERLLDHFLAEDDVAFIRECGATVVRLPLNYRHFERDAEPFKYLEPGFARLDRALSWCARHGLCAILDLHAVQGWQNPDWHCDNAGGEALFWRHPHFQDRFVAIWEEFARRYGGNAAVAGYNIMNEPVTGGRGAELRGQYASDWDALNGVYRRTVSAIRAIDPDHIIFLEGDRYSTLFSGLDEPFADNLVYSAHSYLPAATHGGGAGGDAGPDGDKIEDALVQCEGVRYAREHNVPMWMGEFGVVYSPAGAATRESRMRALDYQIAAFERQGIHWTTWTYKDVGVMGLVSLEAESEYMKTVASVIDAKRTLRADGWPPGLPQTPAVECVNRLAELAHESLTDPDIKPGAGASALSKAALAGHMGRLLQSSFVRCFEGMSEERIDEVLKSFALKSCRRNEDYLGMVKRHMTSGAA